MDDVVAFCIRFWMVIIGAVLCIGLVTGLYEAFWKVDASTTAHSIQIQKQQANGDYQITQNGQSNQDTLRARIANDFAQLTREQVQIASATGNAGLVGTLKVEASAQAATLCQEGAQVNNAIAYPADEVSWFHANCSLGTLVPSSPFYIPGAP